MPDSFKDLKKYFQGKTIISVEESDAPESIATFITSDGVAFRLHATELGYWIEETVQKGKYYSNLNSIINDYYNYIYKLSYTAKYSSSVSPVGIKKYSNILSFIAPDLKEFNLDLSKLSEKEKMICDHPKAVGLLTVAVELGDLWKMVFSKKSTLDVICPIELQIFD